MVADSATELTAAELTPLVQAEQVKVSVKGVRRIPLPHFFLDVCIAWTAWQAGAGAAAWVWLAVMTVCQVGRSRYADYLYRSGRLSAPQMLNRLSAMLVGLGAMHVWPIVMVFSRPAIDSQYLLTMILVGNAAGAISPAAGNTRSYLLWAAVFGGSLALAWFSQGTIDAFAIGILLVFLFAVLTMYVHDQGVATAQQVNLSESLRRESERADRERVRAEMERERAETERERAQTERERAETERDRAEKERERAERASEAKTRFFAAASHDLRQPLMALAYNAATVELLAQREGNETLAHVAEGINRALAESRTLLASLLEVSELDAGVVKAEMSDVDLRSLIERVGEAFAPVANERGLALICKQDDDLPVVARTDLVLIRRIINNLINNAIKFTEHGSVTIETIAHSKGDSRVSVRVTDSGPGIPLEAQDRVFEEFYQVGNVERDRSHGLGLGLAIVRRLAALLNAEVTLFSEPGHGATFEVALPRGSELALALPAAAETTTRWHSGTPRRILILDDESEIRKSLSTLLSEMGWMVRATGSYDEALDVWNSNFAPDALLLDFRLREGASGLDALAALRENGCDAPAILLTGDTEPHRVAAARAAGVPVMYKPVDVHQLLNAVESGIQSARKSAETSP